MTENFKQSELIELIFEDIKSIKNLFENRIEKQWLSIKELAEYLNYSQDRLYKIKNEDFIEGVHYYKRKGKLLFDKNKIDYWVKYGASLCI